MEDVEETRTESKTSESEQSRDSILRVEDVGDAMVDPSLDIEASPSEEDGEGENVGGSKGHPDAYARKRWERMCVAQM